MKYGGCCQQSKPDDEAVRSPRGVPHFGLLRCGVRGARAPHILAGWYSRITQKCFDFSPKKIILQQLAFSGTALTTVTIGTGTATSGLGIAGLGQCTGISSHLGAKLRDWAARQGEAGCYSWAALS